MVRNIYSNLKLIALIFLLFFYSNCDKNTTRTNNNTDYNPITWNRNLEISGGGSGYTYCLAENPRGDIFCGDTYSIYRSGDEGSSWTNCKRFNNTVYDIICVDNDVVFACTAIAIYKSSDNGDNWEEWIKIEEDNVWIEKMVLYHQSTILFSTRGQGLQKFEINSKITTRLNTNDDYYRNIYIDPQNDDIIYATNAHGVERSDDSGITWTRTNFPEDYYTMVFCVLRVSDTLLIAGSGRIDYGKDALMFKSTDNGLNWEVMEISGEKLGNGIFSMVKTDNGRIYAAFAMTHDINETNGVFYSDDNGNNWIRTLDERLSVLDLHINHSDKIFAATQNGIFITANGDSWTKSNNGITNITILDIDISPDNDKYIATSEGLYILKDDYTLETPNVPYKNGAYTNNVYINSENTVFVTDRNWIYINSNNIWRSSDYDTYYYQTNDIDGDNSGNIVCGTLDGVIVSNDNGLNWMKKSVIEEYQNVFKILMMDNQDIYCSIAQMYNKGLYKSDDLGNSWQKINKFEDFLITDLTKYGNNMILVGTNREGLYISNDNGKSWKKSGLDGQHIRSICCYDKDLIFVATVNDIFVSNDGGKTWNQENNGLDNLIINTIEIDKYNHLYLGTTGGGLFYSEDPVM